MEENKSKYEPNGKSDVKLQRMTDKNRQKNKKKDSKKDRE